MEERDEADVEMRLCGEPWVRSLGTLESLTCIMPSESIDAAMVSGNVFVAESMSESIDDKGVVVNIFASPQVC